MSFGERLSSAARLVDSRLAALLDGGGAVPARLEHAMRHAVLAGGKRFRPFVVFESAKLFGLDPAAALDAAAALECVHCYSLVHDDLPAMDNDAERRGQPTVWKAFDEWTAILAGDALLTLAFEILARPETHPSPAVRVDLVRALACAAGPAGMAGGQCLDLAADKLRQPPVPAPGDVHRLQALKTGRLFAFAGEAGAILGGADAASRAALKRYGEHLGAAFQMADDLTDAASDAAGAAAGKATLVAVLGVEAARAALAEAEAAAIAALAPFGAKAAALIEAARFVAGRQ